MRKNKALHQMSNRLIFDLEIEILTNFYEKCNLPWAEKYINDDEIAGIGGSGQEYLRTCLKEGLCNRHLISRFNNQHYCPFKQVNHEAVCDKIDKNLAFTDCIESPIRALKVTRMCRLEDLLNAEPVGKMKQNILDFENLEVFYVVRDPRAIITNRYHELISETNHRDNGKLQPNWLQIKTEEYKNQLKRLPYEVFESLLGETCLLYLENLNFIRKLGEKNNIKIVRYEDFVTEPDKYKTSLYKYLGVSSPKEEIFKAINLTLMTDAFKDLVKV